jgi:hypothetical protein
VGQDAIEQNLTMGTSDFCCAVPGVEENEHRKNNFDLNRLSQLLI